MYEYEFTSKDMIKMLKEIKEFIDENIDILKNIKPDNQKSLKQPYFPLRLLTFSTRSWRSFKTRRQKLAKKLNRTISKATSFSRKMDYKQYNYFIWDRFPFGINEDIRG